MAQAVVTPRFGMKITSITYMTATCTIYMVTMLMSITSTLMRSTQRLVLRTTAALATRQIMCMDQAVVMRRFPMVTTLTTLLTGTFIIPTVTTVIIMVRSV